MQYLSYPKSKDTPSRKLRKSLRHSIFQKNRKTRKLEKKAERLARAGE